MINNDLTNKHVIHIKNETNEYLQFKKLLKYNNIISHAYSVGIKKSFRTIEPNMEKLPLEIYEENFKNYRNLCKELNLNENNLIRAKQAGILEKNIEDSGICSVCNCNQIHSFRAEGEGYGLCTAIISLI